jgi:hypothetical protein
MSGIKHISPHLDLYRYWDIIRGSRPEPTRRDVDPSEIGRLLRHVALVEPSGNGYRWRLMGTAIAADIGCDLTGRTLGASVGPASFVKKLTSSFDRVLAARQPIFAESEYRTACGNVQSVSRLLLPLGPDDRAGSMVLLTRVVRRVHLCGADRDGLEGACGTIDRMFEVRSFEELDRLARAWAQQDPPARLLTTPGTIRIANWWERGALPYTIG